MSIQEFEENPWKWSHNRYEDSVINIRPAPEFATAEVLVASLYRAVGFDQSEKAVPSAGREFERLIRRAEPPAGVRARVSSDTWRAILDSVLESPKQPNQSSKRFLQLCPVVPEVALYSGSARLTGSSWNPGALIERMIQLGSETEEAARGLWTRLFKALSVGDRDDVWARWLHEEFGAWNRTEHSWDERPMTGRWWALEHAHLKYPARQFVRDLDAVIEAKESMTRRQWVSLLEAVLRLASVAHVLWLCDVNHKLWHEAQEVLGGRPAPDAGEVMSRIVSCNAPFLVYGNPAVPMIKNQASRYLVARLGINLLLWNLESEAPALGSCNDLAEFLSLLARKREMFAEHDVLGKFRSIQDAEARTVACKKGIGSNLIEFSRHALGQRQTADETLRGYDQGYILRKRGEYLSAPWIVSLGPVSVLALVHCCLREVEGPRSVQRLCQHLGWYGLDVDRDDIDKSDLGRKLRMLGLVLDSPDAESGMLLVPPFDPPRAPSAEAAE